MSLGGAANDAMNLAVKNATSAGISMVVAAGNNGGDACQKSPASAPEAITVAASNIEDNLASFSNKGSCVDIIAPGVAISSASHKSNDGYVAKSGTSMAAPHVAGAVAYSYEAYPKMTTKEIEKLITSHANKDKIKDPKGSPNLLLYTSKLGTLPYVWTNKDYLVVKRPKHWFSLLGITHDPDGRIEKAFWSQIEGPPLLNSYSEWKQKLQINNIPLGNYVFRFEAIDNEGQSSYKDVKVFATETNLDPVAVAGKDQFVPFLGLRVYLNAEKSFDYDGSISEYSWKQLSGPTQISFNNSFNIKTEIKNFIAGEYVFELKVTDNEGASSIDTVKIVFNAHPTVNAGPDQSITLPTSKVTVSGTASDSDGIIAKYLWTQRKGPSNAYFTSRYKATTEIKILKKAAILLD